MRWTDTTPSRLAGVGDRDPRDPRLHKPAVIAVCLALYLAGFAMGIVRAKQLMGHVMDPIDASIPYRVAILGLDVGEIAAAFAVLWLLCTLLPVPRDLAGLPRRGASLMPTVYTLGVAVAGMVVSDLLLNPLNSWAHVPGNSDGGGYVHNGWAVAAAVITSVNAGVVEEIIVVAIPVLLGRRAGIHPGLIIAASMALRWPYHLYHGTYWTTLIWAGIWGGANAAAYIYLRRLAPLIVFHIAVDLGNELAAATGNQVWVGLVWGGAALGLLVLAVRAVAALRRRTLADPPTVDPAGVVFLRSCQPIWARILNTTLVSVILGVAFVAIVSLYGYTIAGGAGAATGLALTLIYLTGIYRILTVWAGSHHVRAFNGPDGTIDLVARWRTTYTGRTDLQLRWRSKHKPDPLRRAQVIVAVAADTGDATVTCAVDGPTHNYLAVLTGYPLRRRSDTSTWARRIHLAANPQVMSPSLVPFNGV